MLNVNITLTLSSLTLLMVRDGQKQDVDAHTC